MTLEEALWQDDERMSGAVCFRDTRIPVSILFDYVRSGELALFLEDFPDVTADQMRSVFASIPELIDERMRIEKAA